MVRAPRRCSCRISEGSAYGTIISTVWAPIFYYILYWTDHWGLKWWDFASDLFLIRGRIAHSRVHHLRRRSIYRFGGNQLKKIGARTVKPFKSIILGNIQDLIQHAPIFLHYGT